MIDRGLVLALSLALGLGLSAGCKSDTASGEAAGATNPEVTKNTPKPWVVEPNATPVDWPDAPTDGSELTVEFVKMIGSGIRRGAQMRVFNFSGDGVTEVDLVLSYWSGDDTVLGTFHFTSRGFPLVPARGQSLYPMGGQTPPKTTRVTAEVLGVTRGEVVWGKQTKSTIIAPSLAPPSAKPRTETP